MIRPNFKGDDIIIKVIYCGHICPYIINLFGVKQYVFQLNMFHLGLWSEQNSGISPQKVEAIKRYFGKEQDGMGQTSIKVDMAIFDVIDDSLRNEETISDNQEEDVRFLQLYVQLYFIPTSCANVEYQKFFASDMFINGGVE